MKFRIVSTIVVCTVGILTVKIFLNFQKQWKATEVFQETVMNSPLFIRHLLIPPGLIGIDGWSIGDYAAYELKTNMESKQISFHITAQDSNGNNRHWLKTDGFAKFNGTEIQLWRLLNVTSIRPGDERDGFFFVDDSFLLPLSPTMFPSYSVGLEDLGNEIVRTPAGSFKCQHYLAKVQSPSGSFEPLLELWVNPSVRPLGIVRARWRDETLNLVDIKPQLPLETPNVLSEKFNHKRIRDQGCTQCHPAGVGGKGLTFPSKYFISGRELSLTQCLFHYHKIRLLKIGDLIRLQAFVEPMRFASKEFVQFTSSNGSFWVKTDQRGLLTLSLDTRASQGEIRVRPRTGSLALNLQK